jgi:hypothetical protein
MNFRVEMTNPHVKEKSYKTFFSSLKFELILRANLKGLHIIYGLTRIAVVIRDQDTRHTHPVNLNTVINDFTRYQLRSMCLYRQLQLATAQSPGVAARAHTHVCACVCTRVHARLHADWSTSCAPPVWQRANMVSSGIQHCAFADHMSRACAQHFPGSCVFSTNR